MAEVINLRLVRKAKARSDAARKAEANRALHGRTKGEKAAQDQDAERIRRQLEGARREVGDAHDL